MTKTEFRNGKIRGMIPEVGQKSVVLFGVVLHPLGDLDWSWVGLVGDGYYSLHLHCVQYIHAVPPMPMSWNAKLQVTDGDDYADVVASAAGTFDETVDELRAQMERVAATCCQLSGYSTVKEG